MNKLKIAIVTGASSGLGKEFVKQLPFLYQQLDEIWVIARRRDRLISMASESVIPLRIFDGDMLESEIYEKMKIALIMEKPNIRMLINAAGFGKTGRFSDILDKEPKAQQQMIELNCSGLTNMILLCFPWFSKGSRIINIASAAAFCPQPCFAVYAATKSYVLSVSRALHEELKARGIVVTAVCPGPVNTEFFSVAGKPDNWLKGMAMVKADKVVHKALRDARAKKQMSVYGILMNITNIAAKIVPHRLLVLLGNIAN